MKALVTLVLLLAPSPLYAGSNAIDFSGTDWCPYTCADKEKPGFMIEYARHIFKNIGLDLSVTLLPWNRAMAETKAGKFDGLVTASALEARGLTITENITSKYQMCFYVMQNSPWRYNGVDDLESITLGAIQGYSYGEPIDEYIAEERSGVILLRGDNNAHKQLYTMLKMGRTDVLIGDLNVMKFKIKQHLKEAGCLKASDMYFAFGKSVDPELIIKVDNELAKDENKAYLNKLIRKYKKPN
jgi:polar amino acid transport system substrate-binding protein